jgi:hypothetical protein
MSPIGPEPDADDLGLYRSKKDDSTLIGKRSGRNKIDDKVSTGESANTNIYLNSKKPSASKAKHLESFTRKDTRTLLSTTVDNLRRLADKAKTSSKAVDKSQKALSSQFTFGHLK